MNEAERPIRDDIAALARHLYSLGHNAPPDGNISARLDADSILCTPTNCHKGKLTPQAITKVRVSDGHCAQKTSTEIGMHLLFYRERSEVGALVHAHCPHAVALSLIGQDSTQHFLAESLYYLGDVPTVPYATPSTTSLVDNIRQHAMHSNAFILERHGVVAVGKDLAEAQSRLEVLEHSSKIVLLALSAGKPTPLPRDAEAALRRLMAAN